MTIGSGESVDAIADTAAAKTVVVANDGLAGIGNNFAGYSHKTVYAIASASVADSAIEASHVHAKIRQSFAIYACESIDALANAFVANAVVVANYILTCVHTLAIGSRKTTEANANSVIAHASV